MRRIATIATLLLMPLSASATYYDDQYWGAAPTNSVDTDVIGDLSEFQISGVDIMNVDNIYTIAISTNWDGALSTTAGDLFISLDDWTPYGTGPKYVEDQASNGEAWEYVLTTDGALYKLATDAVIGLSHASGGYRQGQEHKLGSVGSSTLVAGNHGYATDFVNDVVTFTLDTTNMNGLDPASVNNAIHWAMSCANDVFEGEVAAFRRESVSPPGAIPAPAPLALLGLGLMALMLGRKLHG